MNGRIDRQPDGEKVGEEDGERPGESSGASGQESEDREQEDKEREETESSGASGSHVHSWIPVTVTLWHEERVEQIPCYGAVEVVDQEGWTEVMYDDYVLFSDGTQLHRNDYSSEEAFWEAIALYSAESGCGYTARENSETVWHEPVTHWEEGTEVTGYEERVYPAWEEEVIRYRCELCGEWESP